MSQQEWKGTGIDGSIAIQLSYISQLLAFAGHICHKNVQTEGKVKPTCTFQSLRFISFHFMPNDFTPAGLSDVSKPSSTSQRQVIGVGAVALTSFNDLRRSLILILLEILHKQPSQFTNLIPKLRLPMPALSRIQQLTRYIRTALRHTQVESLIDLELRIGQLARVYGVENGTGVLERAALPARGGPRTDPARIEQPCVGLMMLDLIREHAGVAHRVEGEERLSEAGGECGLGFGDAVFGAGHLGGVAGDEVEHCLLAIELGDGREDAPSVAGEEDDVGWMTIGKAGDLGVLDIFDGVCASGILCECAVIVVDDPGFGVKDHVLKDAAKADGVEDVGLFLFRQIDALGIASSFDIEDSSVSPAVLVIPNKCPLGICRQCCLASA